MNADWVAQAEALEGSAGEIAAMYLHGSEAREYEPDMVVAAMGALGVEVTVAQVIHYRTSRKRPLDG